MNGHPPSHLPPRFLSQVPIKIEIAFRALGYCRSVSDPHSVQAAESCMPLGGRQLSTLEKGMEASALNLVRNYLNGEMSLGEGAEVGLPAGFGHPFADGVDCGDEEEAA